MTTWREFRDLEPELAGFAADRLAGSPAYLATVRPSGAPRVHPVTPIITDDGFYVFMEPTSPKATDLRKRHHFALHNGVPDDAGSGGEVHLTGDGREIIDGVLRNRVTEAASYAPADRYVLFELLLDEVRANGYGDTVLPRTLRWRSSSS